jgi:hypothetical protein
MSKPPENNDSGKLEHDPPPPVFGTWSRFYAVVVANTVLVYLLLILFSRFAR